MLVGWAWRFTPSPFLFIKLLPVDTDTWFNDRGSRKMKFLKTIKNCLLNILGDIKVYRFPMFIVYDPTTYLIKGYHTRQAMDIIEPGDIVLRGYNNYLDGFFIPGTFSHSSIYVGDGKIIHAVAEGVHKIDIIDFLRCDRFCILRPKDKDSATLAVERAKAFLGTPYDFDFVDGDNALYCHELTKTCYVEQGIEKQDVRILGIKVKPRYTCDSFLKNENFEKILEFLPKKAFYYMRKK